MAVLAMLTAAVNADRALAQAQTAPASANGAAAADLLAAAQSGDLAAARRALDNKAPINAQDEQGNTPLLLSLAGGNATITQMLIFRNADVNIANLDGQTPLHIAAKAGLTQTVVLLLNRHADPKAESKEFGTTITAAVQSGKQEIVDKLLLSGAALSGSGPFPDICYAGYSGNTSLVQYLIAHGQDVNAADHAGNTALHYAALGNQPAMVRWLRAHGANVDAVNASKLTPLLIAAGRTDSDDVVDALLEAVNGKSADIHLVGDEATIENPVDPKKPVHLNKFNALHLAAAKGSMMTVKQLLWRHADPEDRDANGLTAITVARTLGRDDIEWLMQTHRPQIGGKASALAMAAGMSHEEEVRRLLASGISIDEPIYEMGPTPLYFMAERGNADMVKLLLELKASVNRADRLGQTALFAAAKEGEISTVQALLSQGAEVTVTAANGTTPLYMAAEGGNAKVVALLLKRGADPTVKYKEGKSLVSAAARSGNLEIVKMLLAGGAPFTPVGKNKTAEIVDAAESGSIPMVEFFATHGESLEAKGAFDRTPMHMAAMRNHPELIRWLRSQGAQIEPVDGGGSSPLIASVQRSGTREPIGAISALLEKMDGHPSANVNFKSTNGLSTSDSRVGYQINITHFTALHLAAAWGKVQTIKLLLKHGADPNLRDAEGRSALDIAQLFKQDAEVLGLLRNAGAK